MIVYVDVDNTICTTEGNDYIRATPMMNRIEKINNLYRQSNTIIYWTARGSVTNINWFKTTHDQLERWGCLYHELRMGKPHYDLFIDDKNINSENFF